ncbi:MAG: hypothetical protein M3178_14420 [Pseudomonadota bacterium]|nr:hypothetical protein [Pseudomonadota bacterium]
MIESGLVYIYSVTPARTFKGCGALIEGGYIATCRHVWHDAIDSESEATRKPRQVEIEFPFAQACRAQLADACEGLDARAPDLVLLKPDIIPGGILTLQLTRSSRFESGAGHAFLVTRDAASASRVYNMLVDGEISDDLDAMGMRQFTSPNSIAHWLNRGSSGSPVYLRGGQQMAGIISVSAISSKKNHLYEAFVVPAGALKSYSDSLAIADRLAKADPGHAGWQRDLAISFGTLALVHKQSGDNPKARDSLRQGQAIISRLTKLSPDNATWKHDLAWFDGQIAEVAER